MLKVRYKTRSHVLKGKKGEENRKLDTKSHVKAKRENE
jgi:ribosomal protein L35